MKKNDKDKAVNFLLQAMISKMGPTGGYNSDQEGRGGYRDPSNYYDMLKKMYTDNRNGLAHPPDPLYTQREAGDFAQGETSDYLDTLSDPFYGKNRPIRFGNK